MGAEVRSGAGEVVLPLLLAQEDITLLPPLVRADQALRLKLVQKLASLVELHVQLLLEDRDGDAALAHQDATGIQETLGLG